MSKIPMPAIHTLAEQLGQAHASRDKAALKREFLAAWDCSPSALSRALCEVGARSHQRADRGVKRSTVSAEQLQAIAHLQNSSVSLRKGTFMPAKDAIDLAEQAFVDGG